MTDTYLPLDRFPSNPYCFIALSLSYCIMCEEAGCEGEPYGIHDSSQSADGRHDSESE